MIKTVIIDGNNLLHKVPQFKHIINKENIDTRHSLAEAVRSRLKNVNIIFFFDGHGADKDGIKYSGSATADAGLRKYIEEYKNHKELKAVSSDNEVKGIAKVCGCTVQSSEDFWNEIDKGNITNDTNINQLYIYDDNEKPAGLSKKDLKEFRKYFT